VNYHSFFEKILSKLPLELQEFFYPILEYISAHPNLRIGILVVGVVICSAALYFLLRKKDTRIPASKEKTFFSLISQYNLNYAHGKLIRKILNLKKNYKKFLEDNNFFENSLEKFQERQGFSYEEEIKISQMRKNLNFNTLGSNIRFFKTQQLHNGAILKMSMTTSEGNIQFDTKILENYESYFLVSYPQIKKEDYELTVNQELDACVCIHQNNYNFKTRPLTIGDKEQKGIKLIHSKDLVKASEDQL
jgi:hypothetical protein